MARTYAKRSKLGSIRKRGDYYQARYTHLGIDHTAGHQFTTVQLADQWLLAEERLIDRDEWTPPAQRRADAEVVTVRSTLTLDTFAREWIDKRQTGSGGKLASKTRTEYMKYLDGRLSDLAALPLSDLNYSTIQQWWDDNADAPTLRRSAYMFMKTVLDDAASRRRETPLIDFNPCMIENASARKLATPKAVRSQLVVALTHDDVENLAAQLDREQFRALVLIVAYCGLRPGEAFALTRSDVQRDLDPETNEPRYILHVLNAVADDGREVKDPKAGSARRVAVPPHLAPVIDDHIRTHAASGDDGLLFPSSNPHKPYATVQQVNGTSAKTKNRKGEFRGATGFNAARIAIGRPTLRLYDLRHWARTQWRSTGMDHDTAELMLGHILPGVSDVYSHLDLANAWPAMRRLSQRAGWTPPAAAAPQPTPARSDAPMIDPRLLAAMTPQQLHATIDSLPDEHIQTLIPQLPPATIAALIATGGTTSSTARNAR